MADKCWLYKGDEAKIFEGDDIKAAEKDGWSDAPGKKPKTRKAKAD